jgi:nitroreductase
MNDKHDGGEKMDNKDVYDAVWKRRSVRKYLEKPIEKSKADQLRESISSLNEASGLKMEFIEDSNSFRSIKAVLFRNVRSVITIKGDVNDPLFFEKCGYYGERIVLEATSLGLGTCWVAESFNKKSDSLNVTDNEKLACVISVGYGAEETDRSSHVPDVPHRKTISVSDFLCGNTDVPEWIISAMKAVQFAPTARNSQKTRFRFTDGKLTAEIPSSRLNIIDYLNKIDLGITKFHFELSAGGKFALGSPGEFTRY